jgi:2-keto-4-pentenoate hydratase/2-oxohepta-3-ene-1,7-dioic acid hydratase in catechol pathway
MRLVSFGEQGRERAGVVLGDGIADLAAVHPEWPRTWRVLMDCELSWDTIEAVAAQAPRVPLGSVRLGPPVPDPSKIVAIGLNYRDHALEQKKEPPSAPLLFSKAPSCLIGPNDPIVLPDGAIESRVDAEAELCLVIGSRARNVPEAQAMLYVLGFTVMNDVSGRQAQYGDKQFFRGKSFDTFGPCGPWILTQSELADPLGLSLECDWGGRPMQRGNTADLIFPPAYLVSYISRMMTLEPGDLITTGTPAGVGVFREPPVFLQKGETCTVRLEKIGELHNPVV